MTGRTTFVVQGFEHSGGRLVPAARSGAPSEAQALRQAEAVATRLSGAAALKLVADDAGAEVVTVLGAFGDVPDDFADALAGG